MFLFMRSTDTANPTTRTLPGQDAYLSLAEGTGSIQIVVMEGADGGCTRYRMYSDGTGGLVLEPLDNRHKRVDTVAYGTEEECS